MKQTNQYLTFVMREEQYAIPVTRIREVLVVPKITKIPRMPDYMRGIINLRGTVVPVIDLRKKFGMGETALDISTAIIVIEIPASSMHDALLGEEPDEESRDEKMLHIGLFSDAVQKVITLDETQVEPPPRIGTTVDTNFILGMGHVGEEFVVILDIREILTTEEKIMVESTHVQDVEAT